MDVFSQAKAEFRLHLRPGDVGQRLREMGRTAVDDVEIESALAQLVDWGNLQAYHDTAEVHTIADFHRRRLLYQLTAPGEAAARMVAEFLDALGRPVALESAALSRIQDHLREIARLCEDAQADAGKVLTTMRLISVDAERLTEHAQSFFRWLHEQTEAQGTELDAFIHYKERLIEYLRHFLAELAEQAGAIGAKIERVQPHIDRLLQLAAAHEADSAFAKNEADRRQTLASARQRWRQRWHGLRHWFVGVGGKPQVAQLRLAAGTAIPRLLALAAQLHDRRATRSDRRADLAELAVWFVEAADDRQAHQLWKTAFACSPARHLRVNQATLADLDERPVSAATSWLEAPPVYIAPQLRQTGRQPAAAPSRKIVDRSIERAEALRRLQIESEQFDRARRSLTEIGPRRLAEIGCIDHDALILLIELLDAAAGLPRSGPGQATAASEDGSLQIRLDWNVPKQIATIETPAGHLHLPDAWIHVEETT